MNRNLSIARRWNTYVPTYDTFVVESRVTTLGEVLFIGSVFTFGSFMKITEMAQIYFFHGKSYAHMYFDIKMCLATLLTILSISSSGRPGGDSHF
jgi:hypothetical protein